MTRTAFALLAAGAALFVALIAWQGAGPVMATLAVAGWGLVVVAAFHLLPLALDAGAISVLLDRHAPGASLLARWLGESVNSLLPAGQVGGPVAMARSLVVDGTPEDEAAAAVTVATTMQTFAQVAFAIGGIALFGAFGGGDGAAALRTTILVAVGCLALMALGFWWAQRRGLFGGSARLMAKLASRRDWSSLTTRAQAVDTALAGMYRDRRKVAATFSLSLVGWIVGTGEVWLALQFLGHPVDWADALLLESVGQAFRGAAFAIPGALGVQEGGYLLLAPLVGLSPATALALSLAKRARELALGLPGIVVLVARERAGRRALRPASVAD